MVHRYIIKRTLLAAALLLASHAPAWAQSAESLLQQFDRQPTVATANRFLETLRMAEITDETVIFSPDTPTDTLRLQVWYWASEFFYATHQYAKAAEYGKNALPLSAAGNDRTIEADCLNLLAAVHIRLADFQAAATYAKRCNELDRQSGDPDKISSSLNTLAGIYMGARRPKEAEKYVLEGIKTCRAAGNPQRMAVLQGMASEVYHALGQEDTALSYAEEAFRLEKQLGRKDKAAVRLTQMAAALLHLKRTDEARNALQRAMPQLRADNNLQSLGIACNQMGGVCLADGEAAEAVAYYREATDIFTRLKDGYNESHARLGLYNALKESDPQAAMREMERYRELKDSIYDTETAEALGRHAAALENEQLQSDNAKARASSRRVTVAAAGLAAILLLLAGGIWFFMRRRHSQQSRINEELSADITKLREQYRLLHLQYDHALGNRKDIIQGIKPTDRDFLERAISTINEQINAGQVDAATIAAKLSLSPFQLRQRLGAITGEKPQNFIQTVRMQRARYLLGNHPELNVTEVARLCAYTDTSNFTRAFRKAFGITPSQYLEERNGTVGTKEKN
ncbi:MAG: helix-turn-helix domain-containing protein [Alloprevotella sp.]|nr:helix-turn-helix domain-containing protein [Alloprevotella sp.]